MSVDPIGVSSAGTALLSRGWSTMIDHDRTEAGFFERSWAAIIDTQPPAVQAHLAAERALVGDLLAGPPAGEVGPPRRRYRLVVEAGCADGSLLMGTVLDAGLDYLGVDLAHGAVRAARARLAARRPRPGQRADVVTGDIRDLANLLGSTPEGGRLVVFPFNVFGNIPEPWHALAAAAGTGADVLVLTYATTAAAARVRAEYYRAAGFAGPIVTDATGAHLRSGLFTSSVYRAAVLRRWLGGLGYTTTRLAYGAVGAGYLGQLPATRP